MAVRFSVKLLPVAAGKYVPVAVPSPVMPLRGNPLTTNVAFVRAPPPEKDSGKVAARGWHSEVKNSIVAVSGPPVWVYWTSPQAGLQPGWLVARVASTDTATFVVPGGIVRSPPFAV
jgi:hypothetical protein